MVILSVGGTLFNFISYPVGWWIASSIVVFWATVEYISYRFKRELDSINSIGFPVIGYNDETMLCSILVKEPEQTYNSRFKKAHKFTNEEIAKYNDAISVFVKKLNLKILDLVKETNPINYNVGSLSILGNRIRYFNKKVYRIRENPLALRVKDNQLFVENEIAAVVCNNSDEANKLKLSILNTIDFVELQRLNEWYNHISEQYEKETNNVINDVKRWILKDYESPKKSDPYIPREYR